MALCRIAAWKSYLRCQRARLRHYVSMHSIIDKQAGPAHAASDSQMNTAPHWISRRHRTPEISRRIRQAWCGARIGCVCLLLTGLVQVLSAAETNDLTPATASTKESDDAAVALRVYLQLQEQIHNTHIALERNRQETEALAARNAEAVAARLTLIEQTVSGQRERKLEAMRSANAAMQSSQRLLVIIAASFAGVGFLAMLITAYFQWRTVNRLAEFVTLLPGAARAALPAPDPAETHVVTSRVTEQSNARLFGALNQLEKRILELETTTRPPLASGASTARQSTAPSEPDGAIPATPPASEGNGSSAGDPIDRLLAQGQSLLDQDKAAEALACYDAILARASDHPEALVKKGVALEQLRQIEDALRCYDRAIAADDTLTIAYLQKGGLFNRLERYEEALQCYELALRTQEKARAN